jgi:serine/threonine-protein kinase
MRTFPGGTNEDIIAISLDTNRRVEPLIHTPFRERNAEISPDGRWFAYQANESGVDQLYVRPFPAVESGKWQVSTAGGAKPLWARNGREMFYIAGNGALMAAPLGLGTTFTFGTAMRLFDTTTYVSAGVQGRSFDVSPDGRRFVFVKNIEQRTAAQINVVLNWFTELKQKVPVN